MYTLNAIIDICPRRIAIDVFKITQKNSREILTHSAYIRCIRFNPILLSKNECPISILSMGNYEHDNECANLLLARFYYVLKEQKINQVRSETQTLNMPKNGCFKSQDCSMQNPKYLYQIGFKPIRRDEYNGMIYEKNWLSYVHQESPLMQIDVPNDMGDHFAQNIFGKYKMARVLKYRHIDADSNNVSELFRADK